MAWLIDSRMWDDPWYRALPSDSREIFKFVLFGNLRTSIPGLVKGASVIALSDGVAFTPEATATALERLLLPDTEGKLHVQFDAVARVVRVANAPRYNKCTNPNQLVAWYRAWRDVPDCQLKSTHLETIPEGVNLANAEMSRAWERTFGAVIAARLNGIALRTYADLHHSSGVPPGQLSLAQALPKPFESLSPSEPGSEPGSGSGSGSGSKAFESLSEASLKALTLQDQKKSSTHNGNGGLNGSGEHGAGPIGAAEGSGSGPGKPSGGGGGGRRAGVVHSGTPATARRKLPPGLD